MIVNQIEYYNDSDQKFLNHPEDLRGIDLINGKTFQNIICDEIRIYAFPEADFTVNGQEIHIGPAGVYNILLREGVSILSLTASEQTVNYVKEHDHASITITFIVHENTEMSIVPIYNEDEDEESSNSSYQTTKNVIHD